MRNLRAPILAASLVATLLILGGVLSVQAVEHISHHANHHASTHATTLCTWFCAAGQGVEGDSVLLGAPVFSAIRVESHTFTQGPSPLVIIPASRAPPSSL